MDDQLKSQDPTSSACWAPIRACGKALGLDEKWGYNVVKMVGNYGEIFERNVGASRR